MTQRNRSTSISSNISSRELVSGKVCKPCFKAENRKIEVMIRGYQEMADINLTISKLCFEVESEADGLCLRPTECD